VNYKLEVGNGCPLRPVTLQPLNSTSYGGSHHLRYRCSCGVIIITELILNTTSLTSYFLRECLRWWFMVYDIAADIVQFTLSAAGICDPFVVKLRRTVERSHGVDYCGLSGD